jgi:hypothetical protein
MRHSSGSGDFPVGTSHKLGSGEQGKENLEVRRLKRAAALGGCLLTNGALTLDENQEGRLIQERVACGVDEFNALGPQGIGERRRYMVRHEKRVTCAGPKLVDDGPKRRWTQAALDLGDVAELALASPEPDRGVCAMATVPHLLPENPEVQAERLHRLWSLSG